MKISNEYDYGSSESSLTAPANETVTNETVPTEATTTAPTEQNVQQTSEPVQENVQQGDSGQEQEVVDLTTDVALERISQDLGRSLTIDEIKQLLEAPAQQPQYANEELAAIDKFVRETGRTPQDYYRTQATDYTSMEDVAVVREYLKQIDPDLTPEEIQADIELRYKLEGEEAGYSEKEMLAAKAQLKRDARQARSEFNKLKEAYLKPIEKAADNGNSEKEIAAIRQSLSQSANDIGEIEFGEGVNWKLAVTDQVRQEALESLNSMTPQQLSLYADENGNIDYHAAFIREAVINNIEDIAKNIWSAAQDAVRKEFVTERKNIQLPNQSSNAPTTPLTREQLIEQFKNSQRGGGMRIT